MEWLDQGHVCDWWGVGKTAEMFWLKMFFLLHIPSPYLPCINCMLSWGLQGSLFLTHLWMPGSSPLIHDASQPPHFPRCLQANGSQVLLCQVARHTGRFFPSLWPDNCAKTPKTTNLASLGLTTSPADLHTMFKVNHQPLVSQLWKGPWTFRNTGLRMDKSVS